MCECANALEANGEPMSRGRYLFIHMDAQPTHNVQAYTHTLAHTHAHTSRRDCTLSTFSRRVSLAYDAIRTM